MINKVFSILGKFEQKNKNFLFKMKFGIWTNSNVPNLILMFTFSCFGPKTPPVLAHPIQKNQICLFKIKLGI